MDELIEFLKADSGAMAAVGAITSAIAAALAVLVSALSLVISIWAVLTQRKHNRLSVRPLAEITIADYEDCLRVKLRNHGVGPMLVASFSVTEGANEKQSILDCMPVLPDGICWSNVVGVINGRSIAPSKEIVLIELCGDEEDPNFIVARKAVRRSLAPLSLTVSYADIYGKSIASYTKALTWFGRGIEE